MYEIQYSPQGVITNVVPRHQLRHQAPALCCDFNSIVSGLSLSLSDVLSFCRCYCPLPLLLVGLFGGLFGWAGGRHCGGRATRSACHIVAMWLMTIHPVALDPLPHRDAEDDPVDGEPCFFFSGFVWGGFVSPLPRYPSLLSSWGQTPQLRSPLWAFVWVVWKECSSVSFQSETTTDPIPRRVTGPTDPLGPCVCVGRC